MASTFVVLLKCISTNKQRLIRQKGRVKKLNLCIIITFEVFSRSYFPYAGGAFMAHINVVLSSSHGYLQAVYKPPHEQNRLIATRETSGVLGWRVEE